MTERAGHPVGDASTGLADRVSEVLARELPDGPVRVLVALSGGADSTTLLHLLRFGLEPGLRARIELHAAHLDHAMRPGSDADAAWVSGVCRAWGVPLQVDRLVDPPSDEASARDARLAFLQSRAAATGCDRIVTAHHADDQAETVLFRALRGTGVHGLRGIPPRRGPWLRPLLDVRRAELRAWATAHGVRWREDPTNHGEGNTRARLRPLLEQLERVVPSAVGALTALAERATAIDGDLEALVGDLADRVGMRVHASDGRVELPVAFTELAPESATHLLRDACRRAGIVPDAATTERLLAELPGLQVGRRLDVGEGFEAHRTRDAVLIVPPERSDEGGERPTSAPLRVDGPEGSGTAVLPGARRPRTVRVEWGARPAAPEAGNGAGGPGDGPGRRTVHLPAESITLPLTVRGWVPGDRIRLQGGTRRVVTLLSEAGVPVLDRPSIAVLVDADGCVLWIPDLDVGVENSRAAAPHGHDSLWMGFSDVGV